MCVWLRLSVSAYHAHTLNDLLFVFMYFVFMYFVFVCIFPYLRMSLRVCFVFVCAYVCVFSCMLVCPCIFIHFCAHEQVCGYAYGLMRLWTDALICCMCVTTQTIMFSNSNLTNLESKIIYIRLLCNIFT